MYQSVGKLAKFLAQLKLSLTSIKAERKPGRNSANNIGDKDKPKVIRQNEVDHKRIEGQVLGEEQTF